jgi:hypothetical protein
VGVGRAGPLVCAAQSPSLLAYKVNRGRSSMVELQPSKLVMRVRFPSPARGKRPVHGATMTWSQYRSKHLRVTNVFSQSLASSAVGWTGFGLGIAVLVILLVAQLDRQRGLAQRVLDAAMGVTAVILVVFAAGAFSGGTLVWLVFAFGLGFVGIAVGGLTLHEVETRRAAHHLGQLHWLAPADGERADEVGGTSQRVAA